MTLFLLFCIYKWISFDVFVVRVSHIYFCPSPILVSTFRKFNFCSLGNGFIEYKNLLQHVNRTKKHQHQVNKSWMLWSTEHTTFMFSVFAFSKQCLHSYLFEALFFMFNRTLIAFVVQIHLLEWTKKEKTHTKKKWKSVEQWKFNRISKWKMRNY